MAGDEGGIPDYFIQGALDQLPKNHPQRADFERAPLFGKGADLDEAIELVERTVGWLQEVFEEDVRIVVELRRRSPVDFHTVTSSRFS